MYAILSEGQVIGFVNEVDVDNLRKRLDPISVGGEPESYQFVDINDYANLQKVLEVAMSLAKEVGNDWEYNTCCGGLG